MLKDVATKASRYGRSSFLIVVPMILRILVALFSYSLLLRIVSADEFGRYQYVLAIQGWLAVFCGTRIMAASKREIVLGHEGAAVAGLIGRLFLSSAIVVVSVFVWRLRMGSRDVFLEALFATSLFQILLVDSIASFCREYFIAREAFGRACIAESSALLLSAAASLYAAWLHRNILHYFVWLVATNCMLWLVVGGALMFRRNLLAGFLDDAYDVEFVRYGLRWVPLSMLGGFASSFSRMLTAWLFGYASLASFAVAMKVRDASTAVMKQLRLVFYSRFVTESPERMKVVLRRNLLKIFGVGLIWGVATSLAGACYVYWGLPARYHVVLKYVLILALSFPPAFLVLLIAAYLDARLEFHRLARLQIAISVLHIFLVAAAGLLCGTVTSLCWSVVLYMWGAALLYYRFGMDTGARTE